MNTELSNILSNELLESYKRNCLIKLLDQHNIDFYNIDEINKILLNESYLIDNTMFTKKIIKYIYILSLNKYLDKIYKYVGNTNIVFNDHLKNNIKQTVTDINFVNNYIDYNYLYPISFEMYKNTWTFLNNFIPSINKQLKIKIKNPYKSKPVYCKKYIGIALKEKIWLKQFGTQYEVKCPCCNIRVITPFGFSAGHKLAESKGGETNVDNLIPICSHCNSRMGVKHIDSFIKEIN